jgi:hypothetical protein
VTATFILVRICGANFHASALFLRLTEMNQDRGLRLLNSKGVQKLLAIGFLPVLLVRQTFIM